jgi:predicted nucleic acid-binding protein
LTPRRATKPIATRVRERGARYRPAIAGPVVVDASIAVLWFANEPDRWGAERLLHSESALLAPDFMAIESANAWWKKARRHEMEPADVDQAVTNLLALGIAWVSANALLGPATRLAMELGHPVYDCLYLALAASQSASLATADDRLRRAASLLAVRIWEDEAPAPR